MYLLKSGPTKMLTTAVVKTMLLKAFSLYKIQLKNVLLCSLYPNTVFIELDTWQYYWKYYYDIYIFLVYVDCGLD